MAELGEMDVTSPLLGDSTTQDTAAQATIEGMLDWANTDVNASSSSRANRNSIRVVNSLKSSTRLGAPSSRTGPPILDDQDVAAVEGGAAAEDDEEDTGGCCTKFCRVMDEWPIAFIVVAALIGMGIGIGLSVWEPDDPGVKDVVLLWIGLLGDLFVRSLKCLVLPLVFVSIAISVMDMLSLGKAGTIVGTTIGLYVCTTIVAALIGVASSVIFSRYYVLNNSGGETEVPADVRLGCQVDGKGEIESYLAEMPDGEYGTCASSKWILCPSAYHSVCIAVTLQAR